MSTFTKKYYSPKDDNLFLSVSWEIGYRNIQVYHGDRLVHAIAHPGALEDGIKIEDEKLGKIKFIFSTTRPITLEIKVNNRKFKTVNKLDFSYDYGGLIALFTTLAIIAGIENMIFGGFYDFNFAIPAFTILFVINVVIVGFYIVTTYLLRKKKPWAYFIGVAVFLFTTVVSTFGFSLFLAPFVNSILLVIRYAILVYMALQGKHILKEMRNEQTDELLDNL
jgi:hypothetical protein